MCSVNDQWASDCLLFAHTPRTSIFLSQFQPIMKLPFKNPDYSAWLVPEPLQTSGEMEKRSQNCIQLSERICTKPLSPPGSSLLPPSLTPPQSEGESETLSRLCQHFPDPILLLFFPHGCLKIEDFAYSTILKKKRKSIKIKNKFWERGAGIFIIFPPFCVASCGWGTLFIIPGWGHISEWREERFCVMGASCPGDKVGCDYNSR